MLVTWLYFNGLVILLGAVVNAVLTNRTADVVLEPVIGDYRVGLAPDGRDVSVQLAEIEAAMEGAEAVTITVDGREVTLPGAAAVEVDAEEGRSVRFEW